MTERENEIQKRKLRFSLQDNRQICEVHPSVKAIKISYKIVYRSAFGIHSEDGTISHLPEHLNNYEVNCPNRECTVGYFDLKTEVYDMLRSKSTKREGFKSCKGSEAPDHLYQSCGSTINYTIEIQYREISNR